MTWLEIEKRFDKKWCSFWTKEGNLKIYPHKVKEFIRTILSEVRMEDMRQIIGIIRSGYSEKETIERIERGYGKDDR